MVKININKIIFKYFIIAFLIIFISFTTNIKIVYAEPGSSKGFLNYFDDEQENEKNELEKANSNSNELLEIKSSNNYLADLIVGGYDLSPSFNRQIVDYKIENKIVDNVLRIVATAEDPESTVSGDGQVEIDENTKEIKIDVTAQNGSVKTYTIAINGYEKIISQEDKQVIEYNIDDIVPEPYNIAKKNILMDNYNYIIGFLLIVLIIVILVIITSHKSKKKDKSKKPKRAK